MKETGIVRRIDDLGRVVIVKDIRRQMHINEGDPLEMFIDGDAVCFKKYDEKIKLADQLKRFKKDLSETVGISDEKISLIRTKIEELETILNEPEE
jgi:AbrB family looped-hinge helix DNA binding protein